MSDDRTSTYAIAYIKEDSNYAVVNGSWIVHASGVNALVKLPNSDSQIELHKALCGEGQPKAWQEHFATLLGRFDNLVDAYAALQCLNESREAFSGRAGDGLSEDSGAGGGEPASKLARRYSNCNRQLKTEGLEEETEFEIKQLKVEVLDLKREINERKDLRRLLQTAKELVQSLQDMKKDYVRLVQFQHQSMSARISNPGVSSGISTMRPPSSSSNSVLNMRSLPSSIANSLLGLPHLKREVMESSGVGSAAGTDEENDSSPAGEVTGGADSPIPSSPDPNESQEGMMTDRGNILPPLGLAQSQRLLSGGAALYGAGSAAAAASLMLYGSASGGGAGFPNGGDNGCILYFNQPQEDSVQLCPGIPVYLPRLSFLKVRRISWQCCINDLLSVMFDNEYMASHSLTGKKSFKYVDRLEKPPLPIEAVHAIIGFVRSTFPEVTERLIKDQIRTKLNNSSRQFYKTQSISSTASPYAVAAAVAANSAHNGGGLQSTPTSSVVIPMQAAFAQNSCVFPTSTAYISPTAGTGGTSNGAAGTTEAVSGNCSSGDSSASSVGGVPTSQPGPNPSLAALPVSVAGSLLPVVTALTNLTSGCANEHAMNVSF